MKKIVNISMIIILVVFGLGLGTTAAATNWTAFCWVVTGLLWFLFYWFSKIGYEATIDEMKEQHAEQVKDLRKNRDDYMELYNTYWDKYDEKLQENLDLAQENAQLHERVDDLRKQRLEYVDKYETESRKVDELTKTLAAQKPAPAAKSTKKRTYGTGQVQDTGGDEVRRYEAQGQKA